MMRVKEGHYWLHWPTSLANPVKDRGGPGTIVDDSHPLECVRDEDGNVIGGWLMGQMQKMEPAPDDAKPTPYNLPTAANARREYDDPRPEQEQLPEPKEAIKKRQRTQLSTGGIPNPEPASKARSA